jgi:hypothetical protein
MRCSVVLDMMHSWVAVADPFSSRRSSFPVNLVYWSNLAGQQNSRQAEYNRGTLIVDFDGVFAEVWKLGRDDDISPDRD